MKLVLKRMDKNEKYTTGKLYVDGMYFCDTLEDRVRDLSKEKKVPGETAIPAGKYRVMVTMSPRFGRMLPRLLNVPYFDGILIHRGNTTKDTSGCILVGENTQPGKVLNSTPYEQKLVEMMNGRNDITIEIS